MAKTAAVYQQTPEGLLRLGVVRGRSLRLMAITFHKRHPHAYVDGAPLFLAPRYKLMGRYVDGERLPMDPPESSASNRKRKNK